MTDLPTSPPSLSPGLSRSWLLVSARQSHRFDTARTSGTDQVILDIEDAIDPSLKDDARRDVVRWLSEGGQAWVRINDRSTLNPSHTVLREQSNVGVSLGMTGKLCLFSEQSDVVNEAFGPSPSDVRWAREFLAEFDNRGGVINDGSDLPRLQRARRIGYLAEAFNASSR